MKYEGDFRYMSLIQTVSDVNNTFLSRREITCNFTGLAGKLKKLEAIDMINKEFSLGEKVIIPMRLKNHAGKSIITGTFFVYEDEGLAKKHVNPTIFSRLEKAKTKKAEAETPAEETGAKTEDVEKPADTPAEGTETKTEETKEKSQEEKSE